MTDKTTIPMRYLVSIDPETLNIEERYMSVESVCDFNDGYNVQSLRNAISKKTKYKGYYWTWIDWTNIDEDLVVFSCTNQLQSILNDYDVDFK